MSSVGTLWYVILHLRNIWIKTQLCHSVSNKKKSVPMCGFFSIKNHWLCYYMQIDIWSYFPLSSLSQSSIIGLELSCIKPVGSSQVGCMGDRSNNQGARVECLCLSLNGLSHLLQKMNMRCLRCQHCKWILGLWAAIICLRHASISMRDEQRATTWRQCVLPIQVA